MNRIANSVLISVLAISLLSCKEDEVLESERIANNLQQAIKENAISKCTIILLYGEQTYIEHRDVNFEIKNGFVVVTDYANGSEFQDHYNLLYLSKFLINESSESIGLYFANTYF